MCANSECCTATKLSKTLDRPITECSWGQNFKALPPGDRGIQETVANIRYGEENKACDGIWECFCVRDMMHKAGSTPHV